MATVKKARRATPPPVATRLLLIRHGEVEAAYHKKFGGRIDMNLSPNGKRQAKILALYLQGKTIDAIYASPMKRVQQTLAPTLKRSPHKQKILAGLREIDFGDWTSLGWQEVQRPVRFSSASMARSDRTSPWACRKAAKAWKSFPRTRRTVPAPDHCQRIPGQKRGYLLPWRRHPHVASPSCLKLPLPKTNHFDIEYSSITQVALHPHMNEVELLNFTPWRDLVG